MSEEEEIQQETNGKLVIRWKNRRRMAWVSLLFMIVKTSVLLSGKIDIETIKVLSEPLTWSYFAEASIIGAYMGFTTWASKK